MPVEALLDLLRGIREGVGGPTLPLGAVGGGSARIGELVAGVGVREHGAVVASRSGCAGFHRRRSGDEVRMADPVPVGSDVSAGSYRCTNCGYELRVRSVQSLPPCPKCDGPYAWSTVSGGDAAADPYPGG